VSNYEIVVFVVVNDSSTDYTGSILEELCLSVPNLMIVNHPENMGYGAALRTGFDKASKDYILLMDNDGQFDINYIGKLLLFLGTGSFEVVKYILILDYLLKKHLRKYSVIYAS